MTKQPTLPVTTSNAENLSLTTGTPVNRVLKALHTHNSQIIAFSAASSYALGSTYYALIGDIPAHIITVCAAVLMLFSTCFNQKKQSPVELENIKNMPMTEYLGTVAVDSVVPWRNPRRFLGFVNSTANIAVGAVYFHEAPSRFLLGIGAAIAENLGLSLPRKNETGWITGVGIVAALTRLPMIILALVTTSNSNGEYKGIIIAANALSIFSGVFGTGINVWAHREAISNAPGCRKIEAAVTGSEISR